MNIIGQNRLKSKKMAPIALKQKNTNLHIELRDDTRVNFLFFEILQKLRGAAHMMVSTWFFFWHIPTHAYSLIFCKKNCLQLHPITPFSCKIQGMNGIPFLCNKTVIVLTLQRKNAFKSSLLKSIPFFPLFLN